METPGHRCLLVSSFNVSNFSGYIANDPEPPHLNPIETPFGQVFPTLLQVGHGGWEGNLDHVLVWTQPKAVIESFSALCSKYEASATTILEEVDTFTDAILPAAERTKSVFVTTWVAPPYDRGLGMLDMKTGLGISNMLMQMNLRLAENLQNCPNCILLNAQRWVNFAGKDAFDPKLWYLAKVPFSTKVFAEATRDLKAAIRGISGQARKVILLDLDNTLWGGLVGEVGWQNIRLGGHDYLGEAYVDFQRTLKSLTRRGVLLGIVSKNEESIALEAIGKHPEMILRPDDFAGWKINWQDKAQNIVDLVSDLNLGLDSVVFIDDNPVERARVKDALPEVAVPDMPEDSTRYNSVLLNLDWFDIPSISREDRQRTATYVSERKRKAARRTVPSLDEWLKSLNMNVTVDELSAANLPRAAQLFNKTNQMNLSTRRMPESELKEWVKSPNRRMWVFSVSDKFGDSGLTGIISLESTGKVGRIVDFILSCRVMGRHIEEAMLHIALGHARTLGLHEVRAEYIPTRKNKPCRRFLDESGLKPLDNNTFVWKTDREYEKPSYIALG